jgi:hybrid polyketide synthase/nonribosomal peptide synthetase ACE1
LYLGLGKRQATGENVLVLSSTNACQVTPIASVEMDYIGSPAGVLTAVLSEALAASLIDSVPAGSSVLVHLENKDRYFAMALSRRALAKGTMVNFTIDTEHDHGNLPSDWLTLSARAPRQVIRKLLFAAKPTHFLDASRQRQTVVSELSNTIMNVLPAVCKQISLAELSQDNATGSSTNSQLLGQILDDVARNFTAVEDYDDLVVPLSDLASGPNHAAAVVSWPQSGDVAVRVRHLEAEHLFSQDKTYVLFGLSGEIGRSITEWMVQNGAGCVVLTSRSPKINEEWLQSFEGTGASVKVCAL